jgi:uncharacterized protein with HEPN domain
MSREVQVYIDDILDCIAKIEEYTAHISKDDFSRDTQVQDAVFRRLEVIGEAVKNIPESIKVKHPEIEWRKIAGLRDVLIHEYFGVNLQRTWKVAKEDIFDLRKKIREVKKELEESGL